MSPHRPVPRGYAVERPTFAARRRQLLRDRLDDLMSRVEGYEDLIRDLAAREIEGYVDEVLAHLVDCPGFDLIDDDEDQPRTRRARNDDFLTQFFRIKHEQVFHHWEGSFRRVVSRACLQTLENRAWGEDPGFDLLMTACGIDQGPPTLEDMQTWAADRLDSVVWSELLDSDISNLDDRGIDRRDPEAEAWEED